MGTASGQGVPSLGPAVLGTFLEKVGRHRAAGCEHRVPWLWCLCLFPTEENEPFLGNLFPGLE